jgi:hypothetical protein
MFSQLNLGRRFLKRCRLLEWSHMMLQKISILSSGLYHLTLDSSQVFASCKLLVRIWGNLVLGATQDWLHQSTQSIERLWWATRATRSYPVALMACSGEWLPHLVVADYMMSKHLFFFASIYFTPTQTHACAGVIYESKRAGCRHLNHSYIHPTPKKWP